MIRAFRTLRRVSFALAASAVWFSAAAQPAAQTKATGSKSTTATSTTKAAAKTTTSSAAAARARRARLARERAEAAARALAEAQQPRFKTDEHGAQVPDVRAEAAIVYDPETGEVLWESNSRDQRSIASITKVMTAVVFLEQDPDLGREVAILSRDVRNASTTYLKSGYKVTAGDLLHLALIGSDNAAARALARISPGGSAAFIDRMNEKAAELGLSSTRFVDPSGLVADNVSSAYDIARLIAHASADDRITRIMQMPDYTLKTGTRTITVRSTNQLLLGGDLQVEAGKTGFIRKAGYCLATLLRLPDGGPRVAVVVLGAKSSVNRFWETRHLFTWFSEKASELFGGATLQAAAAPAD